MHWSRLVVGTFGLVVAAQGTVAGMLMQVLEIWKAQARYRDRSGNELQAVSPPRV